VFRAIGGYGGSTADGGGGGGRIAIWRVSDLNAGDLATNVAGGTTSSGLFRYGLPGTVVLGIYPPSGSVIVIK
jgi:hypothetical protein